MPAERIGTLVAAVVFVVAIVLLGFIWTPMGSVPLPVVTPDPGHQTSQSGYWCWNGNALPDPHAYEYGNGSQDHACSSAELSTLALGRRRSRSAWRAAVAARLAPCRPPGTAVDALERQG